MTIIYDATERYLPCAEEILPWFTDMMSRYVAEITPLAARYSELFSLNRCGEHSTEISSLTEAMKAKKLEILSGHIGGQISVSHYETSPTRFDYFGSEHPIRFVMKTAKKAAVIAHSTDNNFAEIWHKFEFRPTDSGWILDKMLLSYESESGPYKKFDF